MGNYNARQKWVTDEFQALVQKKISLGRPKGEFTYKDNGEELHFLNVMDMQNFRQPRNKDIQLDPSHFGSLFFLDENHDGRFTLSELLKFTEVYFERQQNNHNTVDIVKEFQGFCTLTMWNFVTRSDGSHAVGKEKFIRWFGKLFSHGNGVRVRHERRGKYVGRGSTKIIDEIFHMTSSFGVDQAHFFNVLQHVSKAKNFMPTDSKYRDCIPRDILEYTGREYINGFIKYMTDLGFEPGMEIQ
eukprot:TRINITY_DN1563_c1_g1_i1.p1 TRINITY_DN1563_c1_g1~~TRINITY_DN1563_c1_g1_i1.p1  ORF type:complete len:243 (+),score=42.22 TRINITY_DN1563_c1_g1_i1:294-1022(+)